MDYHQAFPIDSKPHHVKYHVRNDWQPNRAEYVHTKCRNEGIIGTEQGCEATSSYMS